jgi:hypothetical protein
MSFVELLHKVMLSIANSCSPTNWGQVVLILVSTTRVELFSPLQLSLKEIVLLTTLGWERVEATSVSVKKQLESLQKYLKKQVIGG